MVPACNSNDRARASDLAARDLPARLSTALDVPSTALDEGQARRFAAARRRGGAGGSPLSLG